MRYIIMTIVEQAKTFAPIIGTGVGGVLGSLTVNGVIQLRKLRKMNQELKDCGDDNICIRRMRRRIAKFKKEDRVLSRFTAATHGGSAGTILGLMIASDNLDRYYKSKLRSIRY